MPLKLRLLLTFNTLLYARFRSAPYDIFLSPLAAIRGLLYNPRSPFSLCARVLSPHLASLICSTLRLAFVSSVVLSLEGRLSDRLSLSTLQLLESIDRLFYRQNPDRS